MGEYFSDFLLFWIPFYYPLKLALLVWCLKYDGAQSLYVSTFGKLLKVRASVPFLAQTSLSPCQQLAPNGRALAADRRADEASISKSHPS